MGRASYALIVIIYVQASWGIVFPHGPSGDQHSSKTLAGFFREIGELTELAEDAEPEQHVRGFHLILQGEQFLRERVLRPIRLPFRLFNRGDLR